MSLAPVNVEVPLETLQLGVKLYGDFVLGLEELGAGVCVQDGDVEVQVQLGDPAVGVCLGTAGAPGTRVYFGRGAPTDPALDGDVYRDLEYGEWYAWVGTAWVPQGAQLLAVLADGESLPSLVAGQRGYALEPVAGMPGIYDEFLSDGTD